MLAILVAAAFAAAPPAATPSPAPSRPASLWPRGGDPRASRDVAWGLLAIHHESRWAGSVPKTQTTRGDVPALFTDSLQVWRTLAFASYGYFGTGRVLAWWPNCPGGCPGNLVLGGFHARVFWLRRNDARLLAGVGGEVGYAASVFQARHADRPFVYGSAETHAGAAAFAMWNAARGWEPRLSLSVPLSAFGGVLSAVPVVGLADGWPGGWFAARVEVEAVRRLDRWTGPRFRAAIELRRLPLRLTPPGGATVSGRESVLSVELGVGWDFVVTAAPRRSVATFRPADRGFSRRRISLAGAGSFSAVRASLAAGNVRFDGAAGVFEATYATHRDWTAHRGGVLLATGRGRASEPGGSEREASFAATSAEMAWYFVARNFRPWYAAIGIAGMLRSVRYQTDSASPRPALHADTLFSAGPGIELRYSGNPPWEVEIRAAVDPIGGGWRLRTAPGAAGGRALGLPDWFVSVRTNASLAYRVSRRAAIGGFVAGETTEYDAEGAGRSTWTSGCVGAFIRLYGSFDRPLFPDESDWPEPPGADGRDAGADSDEGDE